MFLVVDRHRHHSDPIAHALRPCILEDDFQRRIPDRREGVLIDRDGRVPFPAKGG
jgi:hypothetical protein